MSLECHEWSAGAQCAIKRHSSVLVTTFNRRRNKHTQLAGAPFNACVRKSFEVQHQRSHIPLLFIRVHRVISVVTKQLVLWETLRSSSLFRAKK